MAIDRRLELLCSDVSKDTDGRANSEGPDQTESSLIWVCTVFCDLSVPNNLEFS